LIFGHVQRQGRDFQRQYDLNPTRCQRITVSGFKIACAYRKSNSDILMVQSAQGWTTKNMPVAIDGARDRGIFLQG
jgi:hypothetical protein